MPNYFRRRGRSGARLMRKPAGRSACRRKCAGSFRFEFQNACFFRLSPAQGERTKVRSSRRRRRYLDEITLTLAKGEETRFLLTRVFRVWTRKVEHLTLEVEYNARHTPGCRLLLRHVSQTGDAAYLPANHRSGTMRSGNDCAETRECGALSV